MAVAPPPPEQERQWERMVAIGVILALFSIGIVLKMYLGYQTQDKAAIDSTINLLVGFVSAIFLYLGFKLSNH